MKKTKFLTATIAGILATSAMTIPTHALSGITASHTYTYEASNNTISSVFVEDTNNTIKKIVAPGESVTTKTGTISWNDDYKNVTAFYVDAITGYEVTNVTLDGKDNKNFYSAAKNHKVTVNPDCGSDTTFTIPANENYDSVFYFSSAGNEAWVKSHTFSIKTEKTVYTFINENGAKIGSGRIGEVPTVNLPSIEGYNTTFTINGKAWNPTSVITEEMIQNDSINNTFLVEAQHNDIKSSVTINYYQNDISGKPYKTETKDYSVNSYLNSTSLKLNDNQYIVGANSVKVEKEGNVVNVVTRNTDTNKNEWLFTYNSNDEHIQKVTAQWNTNKSTNKTMSLNETFKLTTSFAHHGYISFYVNVDKGYALKGNKNLAVEFVEHKDNSDVYVIKYTRYSNGEFHKDPHHVSFNLLTELK